MVFEGHQSIVNSALIHPSFLHIVTSGVERDIVLHGTAASSPCISGMEVTDTQVRQILPIEEEDRDLIVRALRTALGSNPEDVEELETIALFDQ